MLGAYRKGGRRMSSAGAIYPDDYFDMKNTGGVSNFNGRHLCDKCAEKQCLTSIDKSAAIGTNRCALVRTLVLIDKSATIGTNPCALVRTLVLIDKSASIGTIRCTLVVFTCRNQRGCGACWFTPLTQDGWVG